MEMLEVWAQSRISIPEGRWKRPHLLFLFDQDCILRPLDNSRIALGIILQHHVTLIHARENVGVEDRGCKALNLSLVDLNLSSPSHIQTFLRVTTSAHPRWATIKLLTLFWIWCLGLCPYLRRRLGLNEHSRRQVTRPVTDPENRQTVD